MVETSFGKRLKELRESAGLSQQDLATRAGLSVGGLAGLEQGRREPNWTTVLSLASALEVDCKAFQELAAPAKKTPKGRPKRKP
jgi:transcriptional regulator with XRE-family HTH domain